MTVNERPPRIDCRANEIALLDLLSKSQDRLRPAHVANGRNTIDDEERQLVLPLLSTLMHMHIHQAWHEALVAAIDLQSAIGNVSGISGADLTDTISLDAHGLRRKNPLALHGNDVHVDKRNGSGGGVC
jgi:hypothetical protein